MTDAEHGDGYSLRLVAGKVQFNLVKRWLDDALRVQTVSALEPGRWHHVLATYDGARGGGGEDLRQRPGGAARGQPGRSQPDLPDFGAAAHRGRRGLRNRFHGAIADVRIYRAALAAAEVELIATPDAVAAIRAVPPAQRTPRQARKLRRCFLDKYAPAPLREARQKLLALRNERRRLIEGFPTTMVMEEMPQPRPTHLLLRGQYDKPGERVSPNVPAALNPLPQGVKHDRLGLARWLVNPANPLTARVIVNRYWQTFFGTGLVKTAEDFGVQGEWPSHPELLDWLATELVRRGWDVKGMQKLMVTSAAYRQSSRDKALRKRDPDNRLLARGPRLRLSAEMIRDQALFVSGLLAERLGGPSVKPYQPKGLWQELAGTTYKQDSGESLYRRSLYTYWKRTVAPPSMATFDAAAREACTVQRSRTNTPLQALTLMNEVTFVEAARVLAERVLKQGGKTPAERLTLAFRLVAARSPRPAELRVLAAGLAQHRAHYRQDRVAAAKLIGRGQSRPNPCARRGRTGGLHDRDGPPAEPRRGHHQEVRRNPLLP